MGEIRNNEERNAEERAIILRIQSGEREVFRALVDRYKDSIVGLIRKQVGDSEIAHDLAQESFHRAFRGLKRFRFESSFSTWVTRIALNVTNSYFTSRAYKERIKTVPLEQSNESVAEFDSREERRLELLQVAIGELKPIYREVVVLCSLERRSYEEVAVMLDLPLGTVRSRLNTARNQLRVKLYAAEEGSKE